jgi:hypothetical protein
MRSQTAAMPRSGEIGHEQRRAKPHGIGMHRRAPRSLETSFFFPTHAVARCIRDTCAREAMRVTKTSQRTRRGS